MTKQPHNISRRALQHGFTLVELMIVIVIAAKAIDPPSVANCRLVIQLPQKNSKTIIARLVIIQLAPRFHQVPRRGLQQLVVYQSALPAQ